MKPLVKSLLNLPTPFYPLEKKFVQRPTRCNSDSPPSTASTPCEGRRRVLNSYAIKNHPTKQTVIENKRTLYRTNVAARFGTKDVSPSLPIQNDIPFSLRLAVADVGDSVVDSAVYAHPAVVQCE